MVALLLPGLTGLGAFVRGAPSSAPRDGSREEWPPRAGVVPNEKTAIAIAEAVLVPVYGQKPVRKQGPFWATLRKGVWYVSGSPGRPASISTHGGRQVVRIRFGGVAEVHIARSDGRVLSIFAAK
ncbi:MAG TPA: NTF2 fold immunity protein [Armatimonadota bacterium]